MDNRMVTWPVTSRDTDPIRSGPNISKTAVLEMLLLAVRQ